MIPEFGLLFLTMSVVMASFIAFFACLSFAGVRSFDLLLANITKPSIFVIFFCVVFAFLLLEVSFITDDFSVQYVVAQSNTRLPLIFKISALWGGHEGSLLLWLLFLAFWAILVAHFSSANEKAVLHVLWVLSMVFVAFGLFTLLTSNPFVRLLFDVPSEGQDLNPLLQDIGLAFHPPLLYVGYVGFSVAFAFAIVGLLHKEFNQMWATWVRPWVNAAWAFLGFGIVLGSWWAYYELGWGGFWFWDPVENASFMPWLLGGALAHSLIALEKRGAFRRWCLLLAISTFSLSMLGAFLVRSGILDSVHAFASSPERGRFLLVSLSLVVVASTLLYTTRAHILQNQANKELLAWSGKDVALLCNNFLLVVACFVVLLGTLYPIVIDLFNFGRISVGAPYFEYMFTPLVTVMAIVASFGLSLDWRGVADVKKLVKQLLLSIWLPSLLLAVVFVAFMPKWSLGALIVMTLAFALCISGIAYVYKQLPLYKKDRRSIIAAAVGHFGFAFLIAGGVLTQVYTIEKELRVRTGDELIIAGRSIYAMEQRIVDEANYRSEQFVFALDSPDGEKFIAEKRFYPIRQQVMTEAAIDAGFFADTFIALGEKFQDDSWSILLHHKAFVRWVWIGGILISIGALLGIRKRKKIHA